MNNGHLTVIICPDAVTMQVSDAGSGLNWAFKPNSDADIWVTHGKLSVSAYLCDAARKHVQRYKTAHEERVCLFLEGLPGNTGLLLTFALDSHSPMLRFELEELPSTSPSRIRNAVFPGHLMQVNGTPRHTVWPTYSGMLLPNDYPEALAEDGKDYRKAFAERGFDMLAYTGALYQPWWGVLYEKGSYVAIAETPFDFALHMEHPSGGPTLTRPSWRPSMGHISCKRSIRYVFFNDSSYVRLAKTYRAYAQSIRRWIPIEEKLARTPQLAQMLGCTIFPVGICSHDVRRHPPTHTVVPFSQRIKEIRRLRELGRRKAFLHIDGWGRRGYDNQHPDIFPPCPEAGGWDGLIEMSRVAAECGYLFGLHDQYRDFFLDGPAFVESRAVKNLDGSMSSHGTWDGGSQTFLCAKEALADIHRNLTELIGNGVRLSGCYLDVYAAVDLDECCDPAHPMTCEDCYRFRAEGLDYMRELGLVVSSEVPCDCFAPHIDFAHWAPWPRERYMKGEYYGIPVPLHSLVYHDSMLMPSTFSCGGDAKTNGRLFLEGLANVDLPYGRIDWTKTSDFRHVDILASLHEAWGTAQLKDHRILDAQGLVHEFEYAEGMICVDLNELRYKIMGGPMGTQDWVKVDITDKRRG